MQDETDELARAHALAVRTTDDRQLAADLWSAIVGFRGQREALKEKECRPLKDAYDKAKKPHDEFIKECKEAEDKLKTVMSAWDAEQSRLAQLEQAKIQARIDEHNRRALERAEKKGLVPQDVVLKAAPVVPAPATTIQTQDGSAQNRAKKITYGIAGAVDADVLTANDPRVADLLAKYPVLFVLDWGAYRRLAATGLLDHVAGVERREGFTYRRLGGE